MLHGPAHGKVKLCIGLKTQARDVTGLSEPIVGS